MPTTKEAIVLYTDDGIGNSIGEIVGEVVRCKDCVHNQLPPTSGNAICELWYGMTSPYGYCHYGERREDAKTD